MINMDEPIENPAPPRDDESKDEFLARCHAYMKKHHPEMSKAQQSAICYQMWRDKDKNSQVYHSEAQLFTETIDAPLVEYQNDEKPVAQEQKFIAVIGDRFMNGGFLPYEELKKCYKQWEGTLHDLNHMGTSTGFMMMQQDISYFIGYHRNVKINDSDKSVSMELVVNKDAPRYKEWKAYIDICKEAGKIPNVSTTYFGQRRFITAKDLPQGVDYQSAGYTETDKVPVLYNVRPVGVSTVFIGRCSDKDGCGYNKVCDTKSCEMDNKNQENIELKQKIIEWLKNHEEE